MNEDEPFPFSEGDLRGAKRLLLAVAAVLTATGVVALLVGSSEWLRGGAVLALCWGLMLSLTWIQMVVLPLDSPDWLDARAAAFWSALVAFGAGALLGISTGPLALAALALPASYALGEALFGRSPEVRQVERVSPREWCLAVVPGAGVGVLTGRVILALAGQ